MVRAVTLYQPWASLIAAERKRFETRSWPVPQKLIGARVAIHAGKTVDWEAAERFGYKASSLPSEMPRGVVVCTARIYDSIRIVSDDAVSELERDFHHDNGYPRDQRFYGLSSTLMLPEPIPYTRDDYGDYAPGRYAWELQGIELVDPPVPATGHQGFWELRW